MSQFQVDTGSSSDNQYQYLNQQPSKNVISILKHLPEARRIMQGHNYQHQIAKCVYHQPLSTTPAFIVPKSSNTQNTQIPHNRLIKLQDAMFQHQNMKQKIKSMLQKDSKANNQDNGTLWTHYSNLTPSYSRFGVHARKSNFANVLMPINGVNITLGSKNIDRIIDNQVKVLPMSPDSIRFDSHFESGNLLYAYRKQNLQVQTYDLILQNDINTKGHNQWFYFKIYNSKKHNKIRFNIVNFIKNQSMFSYGIKPLVFSERDFGRHRLGWVRDGEKIYYYENNMKRQCNGKSYFTLTFQYYFREVDVVYFAPVHPYTYSQLIQYFDNLMAQYSLSSFISLKNVIETVGGNSVSVVTIGTGKKQIKDCNVVWILGRQHPGQTTSSYMIQGIINYLLSIYSRSDTTQLLDNLIFKIAPMVNVDGVVHGNTRAELTGIDPNRMWKNTLKRLSPGVSAIKKLIAQYKQNVKLVLDLHSHSKKMGCFFYGNSLLHDPKSTKIYPTMVCDNDQRFELRHCRFRGGYQTTARSVLFYDLGIKQVYTVQCSLLGYMKKNRIVQYKLSDYYEMGKKLIQSFIQLQRAKFTKQEREIVDQLSNKMIDKQDAQSARSESSLSDQQYEQIRFKVKNKIKKKKIKKNDKEKQNSNTVVQQVKQLDPLKYFIKKNTRTNTKIQLSLNEKRRKCHERQLSTNQLRTKVNNANGKNTQNKAPKQISVKKGGTIVLKQPIIKINHNKKTNDTNEEKRTINSFNLTRARKETLNTREGRQNNKIMRKQVQIQVCITFDDKTSDNKKQSLKTKNDHPLCVVGSSLEDDLISIYKNQVGVQNYQQLIENAIQAATDPNKKSLKIKKIPKILNYLCSNLIGIQQQNSVFPQDRRLAPIPPKKNTNTNKA